MMKILRFISHKKCKISLKSQNWSAKMLLNFNYIEFSTTPSLKNAAFNGSCFITSLFHSPLFQNLPSQLDVKEFVSWYISSVVACLCVSKQPKKILSKNFYFSLFCFSENTEKRKIINKKKKLIFLLSILCLLINLIL